MSFKPRLLTNFSKYKEGNLLVKAKHILLSITGNSNFPNPIPSVTNLSAAVTAYEQALANASDGGKAATTIKHDARKTLEGLLNKLAVYVLLGSNQDVVIMQSSGFGIRKPAARVGMLGKPGNFMVDSEIKGTVSLRVTNVYGAKSYLFEYTETPIQVTSTWKIISGTATSLMIPDLTSGKEYAFRVTGIGSNPTTVYSDVITAFIK